MKFTPAEHLGAARRSLSTTSRDGQQMWVVTISRTFGVAPEELWDALTVPERIQIWLGPTSGDFRVGGRFDIEGNASGDIVACDKPRLISVTWEFDGDVSWVDATLAPSGDRSDLTLEHTAAIPPEWWEQYGAGATGIGWELALLGIAEHLAAPDAPPLDPADPAVGGLFNEFMAGSSVAWADTEIAAEGDPDQARAAAARTLAFYTGTDSPEA
ncbi:MAG: SRPBCC family protein [Acidimicrobiaceae bacterium]|nr:SRPBCC family protein [Acidimicrobiaceae bacterium]